MMTVTIFLAAIPVCFIAGALIALKLSSSGGLLKLSAVVSFLVFLFSLPVLYRVVTAGTFIVLNGNLLYDSLSVYHLILITFIFFVTALYSIGYFTGHIKKHGDFKIGFMRRYIILFMAFQLFLLLVISSNNIGFMWVSLESTTLVSAFLIISPLNPLSIEAMWKYLIVCSVGIAFAFVGTILTVAAVQAGNAGSLFQFTQLYAHEGSINPRIMLLAFIFIVVGYGTKAGLAPMHTWLPDAHSQSPSPVSAVFSGVMLSTAFFGIMRYLPLTEGVLGGGTEAHSILLVFGFLSLLFAVIFIPVQQDIKRLLAYSSIEHMGIIAVGLGLGGLGTFAALLHVLNHSLTKVLAFLSAGHIAENYGTLDMRKIKAAVKEVPLWGISFFVAMFILIGVAPFAVFLSEFLIFKEAFFTGKYLIVILFVFATFAVFVSALKHTLEISFGSLSENQLPQKSKAGKADTVIVFSFIGILLLLGLWIPGPFSHYLKSAAYIIEYGVTL